MPAEDLDCGGCKRGKHLCGVITWPGDFPQVCGGNHSPQQCPRRRRLLPCRVSCDAARGLGRPEPWRQSPDCSSSHPGAQVAFRCNLDVQSTERVHVLVVKRKTRR